MSVPDAIGFHHRLGGAALIARNAALAAEATALLARRLGTETGPSGALAGSMGVVRLPLAGEASPARALELRERLLDARCDAPVHALDGALWLRLSAQAYNEVADYERLAEAVGRVLR